MIDSNDKAVIFDMDGVLIDSMIYHCRAWQEACKKYGLVVTNEDIYLHEGEKGAHSARYFMKKNGLAVDEELIPKLLDEKERVFQKIADFHVYPHALDILEHLKNTGHELALVTGTSMDELKKSLPDELSAFFFIKVTGDIVTQGKPYPEPYLLALEKLNRTADQAIVVENAPFGIRSAKAAGIFTIALETSLPAKHLQEADLIFESAKELYAFFVHGK